MYTLMKKQKQALLLLSADLFLTEYLTGKWIVLDSSCHSSCMAAGVVHCITGETQNRLADCFFKLMKDFWTFGQSIPTFTALVVLMSALE